MVNKWNIVITNQEIWKQTKGIVKMKKASTVTRKLISQNYKLAVIGSVVPHARRKQSISMKAQH